MDGGPWSVARVVPLIGQLHHHSARRARADAIAGLVSAVSLLPQALAFGTLAGLPAVAGLYTALGAATVFALLTGTRFVAVGPASTMALLTFATVHELAGDDAARATVLAAGLAVMMGVWCLLGAALRLQGLADFLSAPVLLGYLAGVAVELIASQVGPLLGIATYGSDPLRKLWQVITHLDQIQPLSAAMGLGALAALVLLRRYLPGWPGALVICLGAIALSAVAGLADRGVAVIGPVSGGPPDFVRIDLTADEVWALLLPSLGLALIALIETVSAVRHAAINVGERTSLDRETAALGVASLVSGALGGFAPMASTPRTLSARGAGAHCQAFQLIAAGCVLFVLYTGGPLYGLLPYAVLAAIVIVNAPRLLDITGFARLWRGWRAEGAIALVSMAGVLALGVLRGLLIAVALSIVQLVRRAARPHDAVLAVTVGEREPREIAEADSPHPDILIYRVDAPLFFANAQRVRQRVLSLVAARQPRPGSVILDTEAVFYVDATAADALAQLTVDLRALECRLALADVHASVLAVLRANPYRDGATRQLPAYPTVREAFTAMRKR
ncbi:SulP family inorganic anion transporter [Nonomuraea basaltis]|uniref:SulP family inorganic anion transporter n=1 Tax=Nonomuraea basaltis TaxID=2495887 RepID=UPI00110C6879|nr:SulP family inorganic anion transporter [Nonomuraea basaltis]TMR98789.1 SulP family inorganic anion transporter [Nonomuraea basaltis]